MNDLTQFLNAASCGEALAASELLTLVYEELRRVAAAKSGFRLAVAARFAPEGGLSLLQRIERLKAEPGVLSLYFRSHPPASDRLARLWGLSRQLQARQSD